jgi:SEC-C motif-containing protein
MKKVRDESSALCGCGSGRPGASCCTPIIAGERPAESAKQLMRSRFVAYASGQIDYLLASWHSSSCPPQLQLPTDLCWRRLQVLSTEPAGSSADADSAWVEFRAVYQQQGMVGFMHERSRFVREDGAWRYIDGEPFSSEPVALNTLKRNDPCFCGSGSKFKKCCAPSLR